MIELDDSEGTNWVGSVVYCLWIRFRCLLFLSRPFITYKLGKPDIHRKHAFCSRYSGEPVAQGPETHGHKLLKLQPQAAVNHG